MKPRSVVMNLLDNRWATCLLAIFLTITSFYLTLKFQNNTLIFIILIALTLILIFNSYLELLVALTFIAPINRKKSLSGTNWQQGILPHDGPDIFYVANFRETKAPLAIIVHGWRSGSSSMQGRAELFLKMGFSVLIMELPGHGSAQGVSKWNAGVATRNFMYLFDNLDKVCDIDMISDIYLHGHSIGAFVLLRYSRESNVLKNVESVQGYILESPMTCYSEIFKESCQRLLVPKLLTTYFWNRLRFHFNHLNKQFEPILRVDDVDVPKWGIPDKPTLVVQAGNDERLGEIHYQKLIESFTDKELLSNIILDDLTHAGARKNKNRDNVIENWIESLN